MNKIYENLLAPGDHVRPGTAERRIVHMINALTVARRHGGTGKRR